MSEKYLQIGVPMNELPRPVGSANYKRVESSLSNPLANAIKFHDCFHNASMTNLRDLKDPVRIFRFLNLATSHCGNKKHFPVSVSSFYVKSIVD